MWERAADPTKTIDEIYVSERHDCTLDSRLSSSFIVMDLPRHQVEGGDVCMARVGTQYWFYWFRLLDDFDFSSCSMLSRLEI